MDNKEIQAGQELLMRRRAELKKEKGPLPLAELIGLQTNEAEKTFWLAHNGKGDYGDTKLPPHIVDGRRELWESFNDELHQDLIAGVRTIKRWYNEGIKAGDGVIVAGGYGCGKTHIAKAVQQLYGVGALYWSEISLMAAIQDTYDGNGSKLSLFRQIERAMLFIFDDLGAYRTSNVDFVQRIYLDLFDGRRDKTQAVLITTNKDDSSGELSSWVGGRVYSRLMGTCQYIDWFDVPDYGLR